VAATAVVERVAAARVAAAMAAEVVLAGRSKVKREGRWAKVEAVTAAMVTALPEG
jgi:hypothetical protein